MALRSRWCGRILSDVIGRSRPGQTAILAPVLEDEPCQEARRGPTRLLGEHPPQRRIRGGAGWAEQIELAGLTLQVRRTAAPASHERLSASGRSSLVLLRPRAEHAMMAGRQGHNRRPAPARCEAPAAPPDSRRVGMSAASAGRPAGRTSRPAVPASGPRSRYARSVPLRRQASRSPREHGRHTQPRGARGKEPLAPQPVRSCGRFVVRLYNQRRPHISLGGKTPAERLADLARRFPSRDRPGRLRTPTRRSSATRNTPAMGTLYLHAGDMISTEPTSRLYGVSTSTCAWSHKTSKNQGSLT